MTDEDFERMWENCKKRDAELEAKWEALPEEKKKKWQETYGAFAERIGDDVQIRFPDDKS